MVGDRRVVLDVTSRTLHALRPDASAIWPLLDGSATMGELVDELAEATASSTEHARLMLDRWIGPLLEAGLLELVTEPAA